MSSRAFSARDGMGFHVYAAHDFVSSIVRVEGWKSSTKGNPFEWLFVASFFQAFRGQPLVRAAAMLAPDLGTLPDWCNLAAIPSLDVTFATLGELGYQTMEDFFAAAEKHPRVVLRPPPSFGPGNCGD